jgi:putative transposase
VSSLKEKYPHLGLARLCALFGYSRQAYYQQSWALTEKSLEEQIILQLVSAIRSDQPRLGVRKLYVLLEASLLAAGIKTGRDALFELLARHGLLVKKRRRRAPRTTDSSGWYKRFDNLAAGFEPVAANQLWASDITYVSLTHGFAYLSLVTDGYSRQVKGWHLAPTLHLEGALQALRQALAGSGPMPGLIHHSDRGSQYTSHEYVNLLQDYKIKISMTQSGDPRENAIAERINGIIKNELLEEKIFPDLETARKELQTKINIYNQKRPHSSCQMLTPDQAALRKGKLTKTWKRKIPEPKCSNQEIM